MEAMFYKVHLEVQLVALSGVFFLLVMVIIFEKFIFYFYGYFYFYISIFSNICFYIIYFYYDYYNIFCFSILIINFIWKNLDFFPETRRFLRLIKINL